MLTDIEMKEMLVKALGHRSLKKVLIVPPDITRFYSNAGFITNFCYHYLVDKGVTVEIIPALGTHVPMTEEEIREMYGDIPLSCFFIHHWRTDVVRLGEVPGEYIAKITEGLWTEGVEVEVNRKVMDPTFDLVLSVGQVVPHEVVGMASHSKNLFVGLGGPDMIAKSHMIGALYGMERMMGQDHSPVRSIFDYGSEHFLNQVNILYMLTVCTAPEGKIQTHGLFIGENRKPFEDAIELAQKTNIEFLDKPIKKCVVFLDPKEFKSTWIGDKSIYRTRMAIEDGGELIILAAGIDKFGEDPENDRIIRKYGYSGKHKIFKWLKATKELQENMGVAAHLVHGSSDDRFTVRYAVRNISQKEIESVHYESASYDEMIKKYDPEKLKAGYNLVDGEKIFYIPNPALGLWINSSMFEAAKKK